MNCKNNKGFTLIELLIVIAIIGILASVILSSLNSARAKGADAGIKNDLSSIRVQSSIWYDDNGQVYATSVFPKGTCPTATSTGNIFADPKIFSMSSSAYELSGNETRSQCVATSDAWAVAVELKTSDGDAGPNADAWCTDSVGNSRAFYYDGTGYNAISDVIDVDTCR